MLRKMACVLGLAALVLAGVGGLLLPLLARPAHACSVGQDFNPVAESDVIVGGRLLGWERGDSAALPPAPDGSGFIPIRITLRVEQRLKGATPAEIIVVDRSSLLEQGGQTFWAGGAGACGSFDVDPTGRYAVMGLRSNADGTYLPNRTPTFYLGPHAGGPGYEWRVGQLASYDPVGMLAARFGIQPEACPALAEVCAFGMRMQRWLALGEYDPIVTLLQFQEVICPGPAPVGLGGPFPLCDGSSPGERRYGSPIVRLGSEGGMGGTEYFREALVGMATALRLVSIGCPSGGMGDNACGDRISLVFAARDCPVQGGCPARPVTLFPVGRDGSGQFRLATIIAAAETLVPDAALAGGRVERGHEPLVPGPAEAVRFAPWTASSITALPRAGRGMAADASPSPRGAAPAVLLVAAVAFLVGAAVRRRTGPHA